MPDGSINVVRLTPPGRGAIATLVVAGPRAVDAVDRWFHARHKRRLAACAANTMVVGHFGDKENGEEIVARRVSDEEVLLHCHGGTAAVARIESLLAEHGATRKAWTDWAADSHDDPIQAEALAALAQATTERTAGILLDQYHGALRDRLEEIKTALGGSTRGPHPNPLPKGEGTCRKPKGEGILLLDRLLTYAPLGLHLVKPWRVVLAGSPNVGKSSLINALVGYRRAIVHPAPGTTRDVLSAETAMDGWPVELVDTAGLRAGGHSVETEGVRRAWNQMATADLVLLVVDASRPPAEPDQPFLESLEAGAAAGLPSHGNQNPDVLVVHNKVDLLPPLGERPEGVTTSALTGEGVPDLLGSIAARLVPEPPTPGEPVPWTVRQIERLTAARASLADGNVKAALACLGQL